MTPDRKFFTTVAVLASCLVVSGCGSGATPEKMAASVGGSVSPLTESCLAFSGRDNFPASYFGLLSSMGVYTDSYTDIKDVHSALGAELAGFAREQNNPACDFSFKAKLGKYTVKNGKVNMDFQFHQPVQVQYADVNGEVQPDSVKNYDAEKPFLLSLPIRTQQAHTDGYFEVIFPNKTKLNISASSLNPNPLSLDAILTFEYVGGAMA